MGIMMQQLPKTLKEYYEQEGIDYEKEKDKCIERVELQKGIR